MPVIKQANFDCPLGATACLIQVGLYFCFNPIALRKAKIVYNFGPSGCNRIGLTCQILSNQQNPVKSGVSPICELSLKLHKKTR